VKLGRMGRVQVALLMRAAKLHAVCGAVVAAVDQRGLLVLAHGLESSDELRIVQEIASRCQVY
jgi:hypothetical protein